MNPITVFDFFGIGTVPKARYSVETTAGIPVLVAAVDIAEDRCGGFLFRQAIGDTVLFLTLTINRPRSDLSLSLSISRGVILLETPVSLVQVVEDSSRNLSYAVVGSPPALHCN